MAAAEAPDELFPEDRKKTREMLRIELHESAIEMREDRIAVETGESLVARFSLADRVRGLGFSGETTQLIDLLPLVHVAWADGSVHPRERAAILKVLDVRGMPSGRPYDVMTALLEKKPSEEYLEESIAVLKQLTAGDSNHQKSVVQMCVEVARSASGFLGMFKKVSASEKEIISRIADALGPAARAEFKARMM